MDILYCGDANIQEGVLLSALSVARANAVPLTVWVMTFAYEPPASDPGPAGGRAPRAARPIPPEFAGRLEAALARERPDLPPRVRYVDATALFAADPPHANLRTRFTPGCMLRLYADLVPELPDRVLYLDNDVVCRGSLQELWDTDMGEAEVAGVLDNYGGWFFHGGRPTEGKRSPVRSYLNSGVLLLDLARIRQSGLFARCRDLCARRRMFMPDQTALNLLARRRQLPRRYNEQRRLSPDTVLQHFTTSFRLFPYVRTVTVKPWEVDRVHRVLGISAYDDLFETFSKLKPSVLAPVPERPIA